MKFPLIVLFVCMATLAQSKEPSAVAPAGVPAGAVTTDGSHWRWVDQTGKAWIYRSSPFGVMRNEEVKPSEVTKRPAGVPEDALPLSEGVWRWVDADHKVWLFQDTRKGLLKVEETKGAGPFAGPNAKKAPDADADAVLNLMSVKEEGDSLRFSRPGPFGKYTWVKKKTQLDRDETIVWERAQAKSGSAKKD
ncbi:MAG: hypothetical protein ABIO24_10895 [Saprospiraceae bacterium]